MDQNRTEQRFETANLINMQVLHLYLINAQLRGRGTHARLLRCSIEVIDTENCDGVAEVKVY